MTKKEDPYPLKRFIVRIAIPFAIVGLIALVVRFIMISRFHEENVRPSNSQEANPAGGENMGNDPR